MLICVNMEEERRAKFPLMCFLLALLASSQGLARSLEDFTDQKQYYPPDPTHVVSPPSHTPHSPRHSHKSPNCPPPPKTDPGCPPCGSHSPPTPSHGGGGYYNSPPVVPTTPPSSTVTPITPTPTTPFTPTPFTPRSPFTPITPTTPFTPTPTVPIDPNTPPFTPTNPNTPPFIPSIIPGTPIYWHMNPGFIFGICGYWATIGGLFGPTTTLPFGRNLSVQEALVNTRSDGVGELYRQGMAAFLNSMVNNKYPFSPQQVRDGFASSVESEKMAANQARLFKLANEGRLKKH